MRLWQRLVVLLVPAVFGSAIVGAGLLTASVRGELIEAEQRRLELDAALRQGALDARMGELRRDVAVYAGTPPLHGLMRSMANDDIDPTDGSSTALWTGRITTIFSQAFEHKPDYVQARIILLSENGGSEWVRVDRQDDGAVVVTPRDALQDKSSEPYVVEGRQAPEGAVVLSSITLNREHGRIEVPYRPMLRATSVIRDEQGRDFALVVLNVSVGALLAEIIDVHDSSHSFWVMDEAGHILAHRQQGVAFAHELDNVPAQDTNALRQRLDRANGPSAVTSWIDRDNGRVRTVRRIPFDDSTNRSLVLVGEQSFGAINGVITSALQNAAFVGGVLALLAAILAVYLGRLTLEPILTLTKAVEKFSPDNDTLELPQDLGSEAGDLAAVLRQAFEALKLRNRVIAASNAELEQFAYVASHDLQEPLRTITSFTRLLHDDYQHLFDDDAKQMMGFILASCDRMASLIHDLLDYSRLRHEPEPEDVDVGDVLHDVVADLGAAIADKGAIVEVEQLPTMRLYPHAVRVLFQNLLSNALKYQRPGVTPHIHVSSEAMPQGHVFRVSDNGVGIAPEHREKVFQIFQRLHARDEYKGTGIGLAHCARVVSMHSGSIWIEDGEAGGICVAAHLKDLS